MYTTSVRGGAIWWTLTKERQAWSNLQVRLCHPCLSASRLCVVKMVLYKYSSFPFLVVIKQHQRQWQFSYNVLQHNNPVQLRDLLTTHNPSRNLRSSSQHLLSVGYMRTVSSSRCFKLSAAINWNDLPYDIRACDSVNVFKRKLNTHLFNIAYAT